MIEILEIEFTIHLTFLTTSGTDNEIELKIANKFIRGLRENNRNYFSFIEGGFEVK